jgi:hypothetical protein
MTSLATLILTAVVIPKEDICENFDELFHKDSGRDRLVTIIIP